ncbi:MAG: hypothetical protein LRS49_01530 [Desulfurococcales archaeon]|nr:hypothetical protein [Desulfurococcales archaeon]
MAMLVGDSPLSLDGPGGMAHSMGMGFMGFGWLWAIILIIIIVALVYALFPATPGLRHDVYRLEAAVERLERRVERLEERLRGE